MPNGPWFLFYFLRQGNWSISFIPRNAPMTKALFLKILLILLAEFFGTLLNYASEVSVSLTYPRPSSDSLHFANEETRGEKWSLLIRVTRSVSLSDDIQIDPLCLLHGKHFSKFSQCLTLGVRRKHLPLFPKREPGGPEHSTSPLQRNLFTQSCSFLSLLSDCFLRTSNGQEAGSQGLPLKTMQIYLPLTLPGKASI